jgi:hypothetical protein
MGLALFATRGSAVVAWMTLYSLCVISRRAYQAEFPGEPIRN